MAGRKININLAARPLRNRRFFFSLIGAATAIFLAVAALSVTFLIASRTREKALSASLDGVRKEVTEARQERDRWRVQIREWAATYRTTVDALNAVLIDKRFSWVEFLSRLEESLPPAVTSSIWRLSSPGKAQLRPASRSPALRSRSCCP